MDDVSRKVLKRVVAQTNGGIRKPFGIDGLIYKIENDGYSANPEDLMVCQKDGSFYWMERLEKLSVEDLWNAIQKITLRKVMES